MRSNLQLRRVPTNHICAYLLRERRNILSFFGLSCAIPLPRQSECSSGQEIPRLAGKHRLSPSRVHLEDHELKLDNGKGITHTGGSPIEREKEVCRNTGTYTGD